jgi:hypothetical protein
MTNVRMSVLMNEYMLLNIEKYILVLVQNAKRVYHRVIERPKETVVPVSIITDGIE